MTLPAAADASPIAFRQARWKLVLLVFAGIAFCAVGVWVAASARQEAPYDPWPWILVGVACVFFFGLCAVIGVAAIFKPVTVSFGPDGLRVQTLFETYAKPWEDVSGFRLGSIRGNKMVIFDDRNPCKPRLAEMNQRLVGADASLPTALTISQKELLAVALAAKARWG